MRTITIWTVLAISIAVLAYKFVRDDSAAEPPRPVASRTEASTGREVQDGLDRLTNALKRYQQANHEQLQQARLEQARLNKILADVDTRLRSVETAAGKQTTKTLVTDRLGEPTDTVEPNSGTRKPESGKVSETDLAHWMDETLRVGDVDRDVTKLAVEQAATSLPKVPGTYLEDLQCGKRFCRAIFGNEKGEQPAIRSLFGEPPFANEGFTLNEPDGRVSLYFTRPGESLEEFRSEARKATELTGE
ncbi:MAG: hypothetical protein ACREWG_03735 [Gammaproteobacteria bacterium]